MQILILPFPSLNCLWALAGGYGLIMSLTEKRLDLQVHLGF